MRVTISGPPGSGKTTVAEIVSESLNTQLILTGKIFREQAKEAEMDVNDYNRLAEGDRSIDQKLDEEIVRLARGSDEIVIEGRLAGHMLRRADIESFRVFVNALAEVRARRISEREGTDWKEELRDLLSREKSESRRYKEFYEIDIGDMSIYDLVVDSSDISAEEVARIVIDELEKMSK